MSEPQYRLTRRGEIAVALVSCLSGAGVLVMLALVLFKWWGLI